MAAPMTAPASDELVAEMKAAAERATPGPWAVRPEDHDDWGTVRGPADQFGARWHVARAYSGSGCLDEYDSHRRNGTDPFGPNAAHIAAWNPENAQALLARLEAERARADAAEARVKELEASNIKLVEAYTNAPDCIDNDGCHYQSQFAADAIVEARRLFPAAPPDAAARVLAQEAGENGHG